jgi:hypothetical protein
MAGTGVREGPGATEVMVATEVMEEMLRSESMET